MPIPQRSPGRDRKDAQVTDCCNGGNLVRRVTRAESSVDTQTSRLDYGTDEEISGRHQESGNDYAKYGCQAELVRLTVRARRLDWPRRSGLRRGRWLLGLRHSRNYIVIRYIESR